MEQKCGSDDFEEPNRWFTFKTLKLNEPDFI